MYIEKRSQGTPGPPVAPTSHEHGEAHPTPKEVIKIDISHIPNRPPALLSTLHLGKVS
jgi:hypothetical protein